VLSNGFRCIDAKPVESSISHWEMIETVFETAACSSCGWCECCFHGGWEFEHRSSSHVGVSLVVSLMPP